MPQVSRAAGGQKWSQEKQGKELGVWKQKFTRRDKGVKQSYSGLSLYLEPKNQSFLFTGLWLAVRGIEGLDFGSGPT